MNMALQKNIKLSEYGKKGATTRWIKEEKRYKLHFDKISQTLKYKILKARLLGFLAGDGGVYIRKDKGNKVRSDVEFHPDNIDMVKSYIKAFEYLYLKRPSVKKFENRYIVRASCKSACIDLLKTTSLGTENWKIPLDFLISKKLKIEWLRAFFDCEAYVGKGKICLQVINKKGIHDVKKLLEEFGIESRIYKYERKNLNWKTNYLLFINKKESRKIFLNKIGFNHSLKLGKLEKQFASVPESG